MQRVPGWRDGPETLRCTILSERESEAIQHFAPLNFQEHNKRLSHCHVLLSHPQLDRQTCLLDIQRTSTSLKSFSLDRNPTPHFRNDNDPIKSTITSLSARRLRAYNTTPINFSNATCSINTSAVLASAFLCATTSAFCLHAFNDLKCTQQQKPHQPTNQIFW
jgi:hypothetical protein